MKANKDVFRPAKAEFHHTHNTEGSLGRGNSPRWEETVATTRMGMQGQDDKLRESRGSATPVWAGADVSSLTADGGDQDSAEIATDTRVGFTTRYWLEHSGATLIGCWDSLIQGFSTLLTFLQ